MQINLPISAMTQKLKIHQSDVLKCHKQEVKEDKLCMMFLRDFEHETQKAVLGFLFLRPELAHVI